MSENRERFSLCHPIATRRYGKVDEEGNRIKGLPFGHRVDVKCRMRRAHRDKTLSLHFKISVDTGPAVCVTLNGAGAAPYGLKRFCETLLKRDPPETG